MLRRRTWVFFALSLFFNSTIALVLLNLAEPSDIFKIQTAFTLEAFESVLSRWSEHDRTTFLLHYAFDFLYPWAYGFFFYFLLEDLVPLKKFRNLALLAALCDEIENLLHWLLIKPAISLNATAVFSAALFSTVKWLLMFFLTVLVVAHLGKRLKKRSQLRHL